MHLLFDLGPVQQYWCNTGQVGSTSGMETIAAASHHCSSPAMRKACGAEYPGYLIHEAGAWSEVHRRWVFLPRRVSATAYSPEDDEKRGCVHLPL
jgi:hypothetical protein